ncbi:MAG: TRAP transporter substrate-binding protein [Bacillota bacterium]|nr:TRAP transporter substrate-binding protein [Bacillota bacterium]
MKKRNLKVLSLVVVLLIALSVLAGCGGGSGSQDNGNGGNSGDSSEPEKVVLKAATSVDLTHPYSQGLLAYSDLLEEATDGRYSIELFPAGQLGSEREIIEGVQMGTIDLAVVSTAPLAGFSDAFLVTDLPFIFKSKEHAYKVLDGEIGQGILQKLDGTGIKGIAFWENGFRNITNSKKPINVPADMQGIKIRTMENQIHMDSFRQIGADPTPMAFGELFTALQQKTVDGQENPLPIISTSKFNEVQEHLALTGHFYAPAPLLMSEAVWGKLSAEDQAIFQNLGNEARDIERGMIADMDARLVDELTALGMKVTTPDKAPWQEAMAPVYDKWQDKIGKDLIEQVRAAGDGL